MPAIEKIALVADDSDDSRFMLRRTLEVSGCRVMEARNGQEAVELVQKRCPDLILMDLNMPLLDGLAAVEQIRLIKGKCEDVPIIAFTAYDTYGMRDAALEAGCDEYINKPNDLEYLEDVLSRYLDFV
jgi:two-component system, cell cycle response regulator DivK